MIDQLEDIAVEYIAEKQYLDLMKQVTNEEYSEFMQRLAAERHAKSALSEDKGSDEKRRRESNSPYNTYIHLATTQHVRLRNLDGFWSQKRSVMPMVPRSPNLASGETSLRPAQKKIKEIPRSKKLSF